MKKKLLCKCLITLGLLLFFTLLLPLTSYNTAGTAQAASIDEKKNDYRLNLKSRTLVKGKSFTLKAYNLSENAKVTFKSDNEEIASVSDDGDGIITANNVGTAIITVTIKDTISTNLTCDITVGPPAFSIKITKSRIILGLNKVDSLNVILKPSNTAEVARFSSHDSSIASISSGGRVSANKYGMTYLFAEIDAASLDGSSKFAICSVIVTNPDDDSLLETYFNDHPELNAISESDLTNALEEFFNVKSDGTATTSLVNSLDRYLNNKFETTLDAYRDAVAALKLPLNSVDAISKNITK